MIDPCPAGDIREKGKWWCLYKQRGMSMSYSYDLINWVYQGHAECGENVCVLPWEGGYRIYNSPENGVGCLLTKDFTAWEREAPLTLGQEQWPWASSRLTAGFVLDGREEPGVGKYLMFFHGDEPHAFPFCASLGLAWSDDLTTWHYR